MFEWPVISVYFNKTLYWIWAICWTYLRNLHLLTAFDCISPKPISRGVLIHLFLVSSAEYRLCMTLWIQVLSPQYGSGSIKGYKEAYTLVCQTPRYHEFRWEPKPALMVLCCNLLVNFWIICVPDNNGSGKEIVFCGCSASTRKGRGLSRVSKNVVFDPWWYRGFLRIARFSRIVWNSHKRYPIGQLDLVVGKHFPDILTQRAKFC